jgi:hypothetical protein
MTMRTGTEIFVRDLALELRRRGHEPALYTPQPGQTSDELTAAGIPVATNFAGFNFKPEIIHGHHHDETLAALQRFPDTPAVFITHDHLAPHDTTPIHPSIRRYFGVSQVCIERLVREGVAREDVGFLPNFVDTKRFCPRGPLPQQPHRALVFSNYASAETHLNAISEACRQVGLDLDTIGYDSGNQVTHPENILGHYDIIFAKAKAAIEAMAVGTAVVLCDYAGAGPMVTPGRFDTLRDELWLSGADRAP